MAERKQISKKLRFEVFKRDAFKCQYCGKSSPDVVLEVDHINPVANGGTNDILNLITACYECNHGKSARLLSENSMLEKQKKQLEALNDRREQLRLMTQWKEELLKMDEQQVDVIDNLLSDKTNNSFNEHGRRECLNLIKKNGFSIVFDAMVAAIRQYVVEKNGECDQDSVNKAVKMYPRICIHLKNGTSPVEDRIYYVRGIIRNRFTYFDNAKVMMWLRKALNVGVDIVDLEQLAKSARNWSEWKNAMNELTQE